MATCLEAGLLSSVQYARVLVVGTGGIGCELLKNLVLTGFINITAVHTLHTFNVLIFNFMGSIKEGVLIKAGSVKIEHV